MLEPDGMFALALDESEAEACWEREYRNIVFVLKLKEGTSRRTLAV